MENTKVIDKVQKLLALTASNNDHEAKSALMMAQRLLAKHNLQMSDIPSELKEDETVEEVTASDTSAYNSWVRELASIVAENFKCKSAVLQRGNWMRMVFVGFKTDANVAKDVFEYTAKYVNRCGGNLAQTYNDRGESSKGIKFDYIYGFLEGLRTGWKDQMKNEFALVLSIPALVIQHVEGYERTTINAGANARRGDDTAETKGFEAGKAFASMDKTQIEG